MHPGQALGGLMPWLPPCWLHERASDASEHVPPKNNRGHGEIKWFQACECGPEGEFPFAQVRVWESGASR